MKSIRLLAFVTAAVLCMGAGPTTQPAGTNSLPAQAVGQKNLPSKVAIMPIAMLGDFQGHFWIGTAIQQSLSGDISQTGGMSAMSIVQGVDSTDTLAVLKSAKSAGVDTAITGNCQMSDTDLRITVQVLNVATGKSIGSAKVSGAVKDLFSLEDELGTKVRHLLRPMQGDFSPLADNSPYTGLNTVDTSATTNTNADSGYSYISAPYPGGDYYPNEGMPQALYNYYTGQQPSSGSGSGGSGGGGSATATATAYAGPWPGPGSPPGGTSSPSPSPTPAPPPPVNRQRPGPPNSGK